MAADYGKPVRYAKGKPLTFPDIEMVYRGTRRVKVPVYPRGFTYHDFTARSGGQSVEVAWSDGTGAIGPAFFTLGGRKFVLELKASVAKKGWLADNELVLWPEADFRAATGRR